MHIDSEKGLVQVFNIQGAEIDFDPNRRTKQSHPYNYDPIVTFRSNEVKANGSVYTDRLLGWDYKKHNDLCQKHWCNEGQYWADRSPESIEAFLRDWMEDPELVLCEVQEHCNQSSGFPLWFFSFNSPKVGVKLPNIGKEMKNVQENGEKRRQKAGKIKST